MKNNNALALYCLVKRNIKMYLKDKIMVLFSVIAPVIVLVLYVLFLSKLQVQNLSGLLGEYNLEGLVTTKDIQAFVDNWMISGVLGVSCITVAVNANAIMVRDKATGAINDVLSSPVRRWVVYTSYIISCFLITFGICLIVFLISVLYLAISGGLMMSFLGFLAIIGIMALSCLSSAFLICILFGFLKTEGSMSAVNGVFSTIIGFLIGAYLPFSMLPIPIQYLACFVPGTYSASLFRNVLLGNVVDKIASKLSSLDVLHELSKTFSLDLKFFGYTVSPGWMVLAIILSIIIFGSLILILYSNKRTNFFTFGRNKKRKK